MLIYRHPDKDFGGVIGRRRMNLYAFLPLPCQNHYLKVYKN